MICNKNLSPSWGQRRLCKRGTVSVALVLIMGVGQISAQVLIQGPDASVSANDLRAASQRVPLASREAVFSRPDNVQRQAEDIYSRRLLAAQAERAGLAKDPVVAALIDQARERILSDAQLAEIELAALPGNEQIARYARDLYRANPEKYQTPAQTRARHILVGRSEDGKAGERAIALLDRIKAGESFEALAREHSADLATARNGGDLGWFSAGTMVQAFEVAVAALQKPGDLSPVIETQFGFHIVRLEERRPPGSRPFEEVRADIEREVRIKAQTEARQSKVRSLLETARPDLSAIESFANAFRKP